MQIDIWTAVGFIGGAVFFGRFVVQWIASERAGKSVLPKAFWYLSIIGAAILLTYSIHQKDIVFIGFQVVAILISWRNLHLMKKESVV